ncbi:acyl-CoA dehydrogenase [Rhodococcus sp. BP-252]|uniref:acyl-CoA dehydrogenase n=1 Tax=unclassified Rhodococcus (in: high G+C Gram-positive bacteria) TaxID=192944 RepID=UPI00142FED6B|nr:MULTISPECIES: acyl-CoA dehydrogenase [unclassified Rhodococcus (in: high G+C Gram-positive bacteria)]MBY6412254.1 acyl-CoA dehydrogenase [Rhodococcus sp. BP-320]MBY6416834.1 acyl-CoA dehydrogenase [Rhodococcus sp. BP-321]MBY6421628.1 acyl-CoA dehydrogenase [Rhodococcus sp. BP-324]MBY6426894.1 acyl-CoA dehydrogenase [Rhodococcus sp. BP-323]MBY6432060.1 acyl-CoA dehydrogenase [Rhodococcus sp. BP-322]
MTTAVDKPVGVLVPGSTEYRALLATIAEGASRRDLEDQNPFDQIDALRRAGVGALRLPKDIGGGGLTVRELFGVIADIAEADPIVAHILRTHFWFVEERLRQATAVDYPGFENDRWIQLILQGKIFGNASSERGSQAVGNFKYGTHLTAYGDKFLLDGEKFYSTGTLFSDYVSIWADIDGVAVASVIVPTDRDGVEIVDDWDGIGQRRTGTGTTRFTSVSVTEDDIVSRIPLDAAPDPSYQFAFLQLYLHGLVSGILRSVVTDAVDLIGSRTRGFAHGPTEELTRDPLLQNAVGQLASTAFAAESTTLAAADAIDAAYASLVNAVPDADLAALASLRASQAKVHIDDIATRAATVLFEVGGASAASRAKNLDRHWRNIRTITLHNPAAYKAAAIGNKILNDEPLPFNGYF